MSEETRDEMTAPEMTDGDRIRIKAGQVERAIEELCEAFTNDTGMFIEAILVDTARDYKGRAIQTAISVEVTM